MARSDYAHWNEEQDLVWWQEQGRHPDESERTDDEIKQAVYDRYNDPDHDDDHPDEWEV